MFFSYALLSVLLPHRQLFILIRPSAPWGDFPGTAWAKEVGRWFPWQPGLAGCSCEWLWHWGTFSRVEVDWVRQKWPESERASQYRGPCVVFWICGSGSKQNAYYDIHKNKNGCFYHRIFISVTNIFFFPRILYFICVLCTLLFCVPFSYLIALCLLPFSPYMSVCLHCIFPAVCTMHQNLPLGSIKCILLLLLLK